MKRSTDRILTTHTGSLPRTAKVVELLLAEQQNRGPRAPGVIERFHDRLIALHIAHIWTFALTYKTLNYM